MRATNRFSRLFFALTMLSSGCGTTAGTTIPLLSANGIPVTLTPPGEIPLEVVTRSTAVKDPLQVRGSSIAFTDLEAALGHAVSTATIPWANEHKTARPGGLQLVVDLIEAHAEWNEGRLVVTLTTKATLRTRGDHEYIAQTQASCRNAGLVEAAQGAPILYGCMTRLGRDITSFLGGAHL